MIALLLLLQATVAAPALVVRDGAAEERVAVTMSGGEETVRADELMRAMHGTLVSGTNLHYSIVLPRARLELSDGIPFVKLDTLTIPLTRAPSVRGGRLYLPFQFVSEVIPRYGGGYFYDPARRELRTFTTIVAKRAPAPAATTSSATTSSASRPPARESKAAVRPASRSLVVIDAGHGGRDAGMTGPIGGTKWFVEKDVVLSVAKKLSAALRERGMNVLMTRTTDTLIGLFDRGPIANRNHGDLFISIHVNAPGRSDAAGARQRGFETYFLSEAKTEDARRVEKMENEVVKFETGADAPKGDPLSFIITDMAQNEHLRESSDLAQTIQDGLETVHPGLNRGVQQANFVVLRGSYMPAVLVELGFGSNRSEATYLSDADNQRQIAKRIADSVAAYLAHYESRVGGTR